MKINKAHKRLQRVEGLLKDVLDSYNKADKNIHDLLDPAKTAVSDAKIRLEKRAAKKPPAHARELSLSGQTASGRNRPVKDAKKPGAKRSGLQTVNGRSLRKTA